MTRIRALVTPSVMRWARERAGLSIEQAAKKIGRSTEDIADWENGASAPSIAQARKASEVYKRPFALFYLPEPPKDFDTLCDFRSLPDEYPTDYSPELSLLIRTVRYRQGWIREYLIEEGFSKLSFVGSSSTSNSPIEISKNILEKLKLTPEEQIECSTRNEALRLWIDRAELMGIYIFRKGQIDLKEVRGLIICDEYAPFIYINSEDAIAAQLFTLVHELAHLWLNQSGISNLELFERTRHDDFATIETFCNKVASEAVLHRKLFYQKLHEMDQFLSIHEQVESLSNIFKVSEEVIARRLMDDGVINQTKYLELRELYQTRWRELKKMKRARMKKGKSGPSYYVTKVFNNGYSFTQTIISAFESGFISGRDASGLLDVKISNIRKLANAAGLPFY